MIKFLLSESGKTYKARGGKLFAACARQIDRSIDLQRVSGHIFWKNTWLFIRFGEISLFNSTWSAYTCVYLSFLYIT